MKTENKPCAYLEFFCSGAPAFANTNITLNSESFCSKKGLLMKEFTIEYRENMDNKSKDKLKVTKFQNENMNEKIRKILP